MRIGVLARSDDRGIGIQTWEVARHLPASPLVVRHPTSEAQGFPSRHAERYPGAPVVEWNEHHELPETEVRDWLTTVDVVYSVESLMDRRLAGWAREAGVATVVHANPELWRGDISPSTIWLPTPWRATDFDRPQIVPVPAADDRDRWEPHDGPLRILHVVGRRAAHDRNGTSTLLRALRHITQDVEVTVHTQTTALPAAPRNPRVTYRRVGAVDDRWSMYDGQDVLVLPRRYGGLCLPAQEAMASGLALALPAVSPSGWYRAILLGPVAEPIEARTVTLPGGRFPLADVDPRALARQIDQLAAEPHLVEEGRAAAREWVDQHSWSRLRSVYLDQLARAAGL